MCAHYCDAHHYIHLQNSTFWPGLGESDTFYSWAVSIFPIGEVLMSLVAAYLSTATPYLYTIPLTCCIAAVGGLVYALASHGVMVIVARFLFGTTNGLSLVLAQAYIGRENKRKRGPTVEKMLLFYSITMSSSLIAATGMCTIILLLYAFHHTCYSFLPSIVSILSPTPTSLSPFSGISALIPQFPNVNPYRWGGWFIFVVAVTYCVAFLTVYSKTKLVKPNCGGTCSLSRQSPTHTRTKGLAKQVIVSSSIKKTFTPTNCACIY